MAFVEISIGYQDDQYPLISKGISKGILVPSGPCACLTHLGEPLNVRVLADHCLPYPVTSLGNEGEDAPSHPFSSPLAWVLVIPVDFRTGRGAVGNWSGFLWVPTWNPESLSI